MENRSGKVGPSPQDQRVVTASQEVSEREVLIKRIVEEADEKLLAMSGEPRVAGKRLSLCGASANIVRDVAEAFGLTAPGYQSNRAHRRFGGSSAGDNGFSHVVNIVRDGERIYLIDLTLGQYVHPETGRISHAGGIISSGSISDHPIVTDLIRDGYIELTDESFRAYIRATSGVTDKSYIDDIRIEEFLSDPPLMI